MNITKQKQAHRYRGQTSGYQCNEWWEEGKYRGMGEKGLLWDYMKSSV